MHFPGNPGIDLAIDGLDAGWTYEHGRIEEHIIPGGACFKECACLDPAAVLRTDPLVGPGVFVGHLDCQVASQRLDGVMYRRCMSKLREDQEPDIEERFIADDRLLGHGQHSVNTITYFGSLPRAGKVRLAGSGMVSVSHAGHSRAWGIIRSDVPATPSSLLDLWTGCDPRDQRLQ